MQRQSAAAPIPQRGRFPRGQHQQVRRRASRPTPPQPCQTSPSRQPRRRSAAGTTVVGREGLRVSLRSRRRLGRGDSPQRERPGQLPGPWRAWRNGVASICTMAPFTRVWVRTYTQNERRRLRGGSSCTVTPGLRQLTKIRPAHQLVVGGVVGDLQKAGLAGDRLGRPREVASIEAEGAELERAAADADAADGDVRADLSVARDAAELVPGSGESHGRVL